MSEPTGRERTNIEIIVRWNRKWISVLIVCDDVGEELYKCFIFWAIIALVVYKKENNPEREAGGSLVWVLFFITEAFALTSNNTPHQRRHLQQAAPVFLCYARFCSLSADVLPVNTTEYQEGIRNDPVCRHVSYHRERNEKRRTFKHFLRHWCIFSKVAHTHTNTHTHLLFKNKQYASVLFHSRSSNQPHWNTFAPRLNNSSLDLRGLTQKSAASIDVSCFGSFSRIWSLCTELKLGQGRALGIQTG